MQINFIVANTKTLGQVSQIFVTNKTFERRDCPGTTCGGAGVFAFGEHGAIDSILAARPRIWNEMGVVAALNYLIGEQEKATPRFVSGEIAMIIIDSKGVHWLQKAACQEDQPRASEAPKAKSANPK